MRVRIAGLGGGLGWLRVWLITSSVVKVFGFLLVSFVFSFWGVFAVLVLMLGLRRA